MAQNKDFMMYRNEMKFKIQRLPIKLNWNTETHICLHVVYGCFHVTEFSKILESLKYGMQVLSKISITWTLKKSSPKSIVFLYQ